MMSTTEPLLFSWLTMVAGWRCLVILKETVLPKYCRHAFYENNQNSNNCTNYQLRVLCTNLLFSVVKNKNFFFSLSRNSQYWERYTKVNITLFYSLRYTKQNRAPCIQKNNIIVNSFIHKSTTIITTIICLVLCLKTTKKGIVAKLVNSSGL